MPVATDAAGEPDDEQLAQIPVADPVSLPREPFDWRTHWWIPALGVTVLALGLALIRRWLKRRGLAPAVPVVPAHEWARARIAHEQRDSDALRSLLEAWVAHRDTRYVMASLIEQEYYRLGDYAEHIHWFVVRDQEKNLLHWVPMTTLRDQPDYWDRLTEWVLDDPAEVRSRMALLNEHRARIDRITEKLVLPRDFIE